MLNFKLCLKISMRFILQVAQTSSPVEGKLLQLHSLSDAEWWSQQVHECTQIAVCTAWSTVKQIEIHKHSTNGLILSSCQSCPAGPLRFALVDSWVFPSPWGWCSAGTALEELGQGFMSLTEAPLVSLCSSVWVWAFHHRTVQVISGNRNGTETLEITQDLGMFGNA